MVFSHVGFPHSEISGLKVGTHLPGAFRSYPTSFIASHSQGIHHLAIINLQLTFLMLFSLFSLKEQDFKKPLRSGFLKNFDKIKLLTASFWFFKIIYFFHATLFYLFKIFCQDFILTFS